MRIAHLLSVAVALLAGCSPVPLARAPEGPPFTTDLNLKQVMNWVIDPAADVVWDSVKTLMSTEGTKEIAPKTEDEWAAVRTGAATLMEAGNMLMLDGRAMDQKVWMASARRLSRAGAVALRAVEAKNAEGVFNAGGEIYNACKSCHDNYAHFDEKQGAAGPGMRGKERYALLSHSVRLNTSTPQAH
jgi:hypothetical protein